MTITIDRSEALILIDALNTLLSTTFNQCKASDREKLSQKFESILTLKSKISHVFDGESNLNLKIEKP